MDDGMQFIPERKSSKNCGFNYRFNLKRVRSQAIKNILKKQHMHIQNFDSRKSLLEILACRKTPSVLEQREMRDHITKLIKAEEQIERACVEYKRRYVQEINDTARTDFQNQILRYYERELPLASSAVRHKPHTKRCAIYPLDIKYLRISPEKRQREAYQKSLHFHHFCFHYKAPSAGSISPPALLSPLKKYKQRIVLQNSRKIHNSPSSEDYSCKNSISCHFNPQESINIGKPNRGQSALARSKIVSNHFPYIEEEKEPRMTNQLIANAIAPGLRKKKSGLRPKEVTVNFKIFPPCSVNTSTFTLNGHSVTVPLKAFL